MVRITIAKAKFPEDKKYSGYQVRINGKAQQAGIGGEANWFSTKAKAKKWQKEVRKYYGI